MLKNHGNVVHTILLHFATGFIIYLPIGFVFQYVIYAQYAMSATYMGYSVLAYFCGAILYVCFVALHFKVSTQYYTLLVSRFEYPKD
jgi:hypothetical protein